MKIGWICAGSINSGGSRMSVFHNHHYFQSIGIESKIIHSPVIYCIKYEPTDEEINKIILEKFDIVFIQKVCMGRIKELTKLLQKNGTKVGFGIGDFFGQEMVELCDFVVTASEYLKNLYQKVYHNKIHVIMDGYEAPDNLLKKHINSDILNVIYYGTQDIDKKFEKNINSINWINFKKLGNLPWANIKWNLKTVYEDMLKFDVCIIYTQMTNFNKSKSLNRPLNCMAIGIPVITSPIPSYYNIINNGINGFTCNSNTFNEFNKYLEILKSSSRRQEISEKAKLTIKNHTMKNQSEQYLNLFKLIGE